MQDVEKISYKGMMQDLLKSKHPNTYYFKGRNIRISNSNEQADTGVLNEDGNAFVVSIPSPSINLTDSTIDYAEKSLSFRETTTTEITNMPSDSLDQVIIGSVPTRDSFIVFSTDGAGFDCVWELIIADDTTNYDLTLLYARDLSLETTSPIQAVYNYENSKLQKIYWVDGKNQLRFLNIKHSVANGDLEELIDVNSNTINIIGEFDVSQPVINTIGSGGTHTAGVIQYAYNLYRINGSQTTISPLSLEIPLGKGILGGGEVNEVVGESPIVEIPEIDDQYTHIKIYAIKYTSYNEEPAVSLIHDEAITAYTNFSYYDTGGTISTVSLSEFLFLGGNPIVPQHIANKYNILFAANILEKQFLLDIDMRAYSHNSTGDYEVYSDLFLNGQIITGSKYSETHPNITYNVPETHDAINIDFDTFRYQANGNILGGEGKYITYELVATAEENLPSDLKYYKFFKSNEVYRIGIQFYNKLGQISFPKWIADFRAPDNNLNGTYNTLKVTLKSTEFTQYIDSLGLEEDEKPVGFRILRALRDINDRSIICQGALTPMMVQTTEESRNWDRWSQESERAAESEERVKFPTLFTKEFNGNTPPFIYGNTHLSFLHERHGGQNGEIFRDSSVSNRVHTSWLYATMFQMYSPDILFGTGVGEGFGLKLRVKGVSKNPVNNTWHKTIDIEDLTEKFSYKYTDTNNYLDGTTRSLVGPSEGGSHMRFVQVNKAFSGYEANTVVEYDINGTPEITERGQGITSYNGDGKLQYSNSVEGVISDASNSERAVTSINSWGARSMTFVLNNSESLQDLFDATGIADTESILIAELVKPEDQILLGNMYGGNSYERKLSTEYVEIGEYKETSDGWTDHILSPGDTYAGQFKVGRLTKTDTQVLSDRSYQITEILEFPSESSVNIHNRSDQSLQSWDSIYQPRHDEYHNYNRVYSVQPSIIQRVDKNFKVKAVTEFDTRIMASKTKTPGEFIDSWTDFLDNEIMDLEGQYGDINALINSNNEIYALQDTGVARITVKPSTQVQASDGITLELGRGNILYDYKYISTSSGTYNKWSVVTSPAGFYYYDLPNKSIMLGNRESVINLSNLKGFRSYLSKNSDYNSLIQDQPILSNGVSAVFNTFDKMMYMTFRMPQDSFTICFSESDEEFTSFYDFMPGLYLQRGPSLLSTAADGKTLYKHGLGNKGEFYGEIYPSTITLLAAPKPDFDKTFNNLMFKSECYSEDGTDLPLATVNTLRVWNEFQDTGTIILNVGRRGNIDRLYRQWSVNIPKIPGTRQRVRNPWAFIEIGIDNYENNELIMHDMLVSYTL